MSFIIFIAIVLIFALRGYFIGLSGILVKGVSLSLAIVVAITQYPWAAYQLQPYFPEQMMIPPLVKSSLSGLLLFLAVLFTLRFSIYLIFKLFSFLAGEKVSQSLALTNRVTGALVNSVFGGLLAGLLLWIVFLVVGNYSPHSIKDDDFGLAVAQFVGSTAFKVSLPVLEKMGLQVPPGFEDKLMIKNITHPATVSDSSVKQNLNGLQTGAKTSAELSDQLFFYRMLENVQGAKNQLQQSQKTAVNDHGLTGNKSEMNYSEIAQRLLDIEQVLQQNPAVAKVFQDPSVMKSLQQGNISAVFDSNEFKSLAQKVDPKSMDSIAELLLLLDKQNVMNAQSEETATETTTP